MGSLEAVYNFILGGINTMLTQIDPVFILCVIVFMILIFFILISRWFGAVDKK